ncbi:MAG: hypothetical protein LBS39_00935 [Campylobacteraceae bacterium]|jgi:hypothetical protein|nr:hypothetical protein [Campylobacteraceae bacterium]
MKAKEVFSEIGSLIEQHYKALKFRYSKSYRWVQTKNRQFEFIISFSSGVGNTKNDISLAVDFIINDMKIKEQIVFISLWKHGHYYHVDQENTIVQIFEKLIIQIDLLLIPFIVKLENMPKYKDEWINRGFLGDNAKYPFQTNIVFINEYYGKKAAEICLHNYFDSLNSEAKKNFLKVYECERQGIPLDLNLPFELDENYFNYSIIKDSVKLQLLLK